MAGLIVAPWQADERPRRPAGFLFAGTTFAPRVEAPDESPSRGTDASDAWRTLAASPRFLEHHAEDLRLARELGLGAIGFSLSWARLMPGGRGRVRRDALDAYRGVAEAATALGLRVVVTLWHHDLPLAPRPSWAESDMPERFAEIAEQAGVRLGDLVSFVTLDEPGVLALPHARSAIAGSAERAAAAHAAEARGAARAHALAMEALKATCRAEIGLATELVTSVPLGRDAGDAPAARFVEAARSLAWLHLAAGRRGVLTRSLEAHGATTPLRAQVLGGIDAAEAPACDFVIVRPLPAVRVAFRRLLPFDLQVEPAGRPLDPWIPLVAAWAELAPAGTGPALHVASRHEGPSGAPDEEPDAETGRIEDAARAAALAGDLAAWEKAVAAGVPLAGWFTSLLDGYEMEQGWAVRSGVVHVSWRDRRRRVKASGERLRGLVEAWS